MRNKFDDWKNSDLSAGRAWAQRGLAWAAASTATAAVWLSVVLMAGLDLPAGAARGLEAAAPLSAPLAAAAPPSAEPRAVRHAAMLPRVTITGKRESALPVPVAAGVAVEVGEAPAGPASAGRTIGITVAGDNLNQ